MPEGSSARLSSDRDASLSEGRPAKRPDGYASPIFVVLHKLGVSPGTIVHNTIVVRTCPAIMVVRYWLLLLLLLLLLILL